MLPNTVNSNVELALGPEKKKVDTSVGQGNVPSSVGNTQSHPSSVFRVIQKCEPVHHEG